MSISNNLITLVMLGYTLDYMAGMCPHHDMFTRLSTYSYSIGFPVVSVV